MGYISGVVLEKHNQLKRTDQSLRIKPVTIILHAILYILFLNVQFVSRQVLLLFYCGFEM